MLKELFVKDIYRDINGVIQAGQLDEARIAQELDEYVVTDEIAEHLEDLLEHYVKSLTQPTDKIGVWISGFFGSGKSHFLKIISYLLGQVVANGKPAVAYFREKNLSPRLMEWIELGSRYKAATLLFNIEAKTAVGVRGTRQNIVEVFLRVFNEFLGYSETLWIAEIEHILAQEGKLQAFQESVRRIFGREWREVRDTLALQRKQFVMALREIGYDEASADTFLRIAQQNFSITPEQFARRVAGYCRAQGPEFRLIFLVDEVGQYIGDDSELMLNLQTVVEELGNHGRGQIWVMVTSQESIDMVTNVRGREYDFSKIQGRFRTRINLSSTNTDDVIKWRILQKTDVAAASLRALYDQNEQSIRNMLSFDANTHALKAGYRSSHEFAEVYPFQPYQFELLQKVFEKVRRQGEAGKSLSHGERSLLNAFQDALIELDRTGSVDTLAPFWMFYDTIETFLDGSVKSTVRRAAGRDDLEELDVRVLKVLYLIKNITEIKATVANVTTLLIDRLGVIRRGLEQQVQTSLDRLVRHNLVSLNADGTYSFLSDEEQEINREIAAERIDEAQLAASLGNIFFTEICPKKYRAANGRDFDFNKRFDSYVHGAQREKLTLHVLTSVGAETAGLKSLEPGVLVMWIPPSITDYREAMERSLQIEQYARRDRTGLSDSQRRIIDDKQQREALEFRKKAKTLLMEACKQASFYVLGQEERYSGSPETHLERALEKLIANTYTHLDYIDHPLSVSQELQAIVELARHGAPPTLSGRANELALQALQQFLDERDHQDLPTTVEDVVAHFTDPPFGWMDRDIVGLVAVLLHEGQVRLSYLGETLGADTPQFAERMLRPAERGKVVVKRLREVPADIQSRIRALLNRVFEEAPGACDSYDALADFIRQQLDAQWAAPLREIIEQQNNPPQAGGVTYRYPDEALAKHLQTEVSRLLAIRDSEALVHEMLQLGEDLDQWAAQVTRLRGFFRHPRTLFDQAVQFLHEYNGEWPHLAYYPELLAKRDAIESILRDPSPYSKIPNLPRLVDELRASLQRVLDERRHEFIPRIQDVLTRIEEMEQIYRGDDEAQSLIAATKQAVQGFLDQIAQETRLSALAGYVTYAQDALSDLGIKLQALLNGRQARQGQVVKESGVHGVAGHYAPGTTVVTDTRREMVITVENLLKEIAPTGEVRMTSLEDLDIYLAKVKEVLLRVLHEQGVIIIRGR